MLLVNGVARFVGNMLGGWVSSKKVNLSVIVAAGLLDGSALLLFLLGSSQVAYFVAVTVWGLGFGMVPIAMQSFLQSAARDALEDMQAMGSAIVPSVLTSALQAYVVILAVPFDAVENVLRSGGNRAVRQRFGKAPRRCIGQTESSRSLKLPAQIDAWLADLWAPARGAAPEPINRSFFSPLFGIV